jgi:hypothetical protein
VKVAGAYVYGHPLLNTIRVSIIFCSEDTIKAVNINFKAMLEEIMPYSAGYNESSELRSVKAVAKDDG